MILGIGVDVVRISSFVGQLDRPGTRFAEVFTARERREAARRPDPAASLAARWAAKEAFVKAWSSALRGRPPVVGEQEAWPAIEVASDRWGRPRIQLLDPVSGAVRESLAGAVREKRAAGAPFRQGVAPPTDGTTSMSGFHSAGPAVSQGAGVPAPDGVREVDIHVSMSHDGDYCVAFVVLS